MAYFASTQELIGNTPIVKLTHVALPDGVNLFAKLEAFDNARELARKEGIFAGSFSGAALAAAKKFALAGNRGNFVIILPDRGDRYFSKHLYV